MTVSIQSHTHSQNTIKALELRAKNSSTDQIDLNLPFFKNQTFFQFVSETRPFCGRLDSTKRNRLLNHLKNHPHLNEFSNEELLNLENFTFNTSYKAIIDAVNEKYSSRSKNDGIFVRGGCVKRVAKPHPLKSLPPDLDILVDASDLTMDDIDLIEKGTFEHIAQVLSAKKPHLKECYYVLASLCCNSRREIIAIGGEYSLTTIPALDAPDLELIIFRKLERRYLCRSDNLLLHFYKQTVQTNNGMPVDDVLCDLQTGTLTIPDPQSVQGLGVARIISLITGGDLIREKTMHLFQQTEEKEVCERLEKTCKNHHGSSLAHLAAMFWNLYVFTDCKLEYLYKKALEIPLELEFQKHSDLHEWLLTEVAKKKCTLDFEVVSHDGRDWIRFREDDLHWFLPLPDDAYVAQLILRSRKPIPGTRLSEMVGCSVETGLSTLIRSPFSRWHVHVLAHFKTLKGDERKRCLKEILKQAHEQATPTLLRICSELPLSKEWFFHLLNWFMQCRMNISLFVPELCGMALRLNPPKKVSLYIDWLITRVHDTETACSLYNHFARTNYTQPPECLLVKGRIQELDHSDLLDNPIFILLTPEQAYPHLVRALRIAPSHFLDHFFYRCFSENRLKQQQAETLFAELIPRFSFVNCDWVMDLFPERIPFEIFSRLPPLVAKKLATKFVIDANYLHHLSSILQSNLDLLHEFYTEHPAVVEEHCFPSIAKLTERLMRANKHAEAARWIEVIIRTSFPAELEGPYANSCRLAGAYDLVAEVACAGSLTTPEVALELLNDPLISTSGKIPLLNRFPQSELAFWRVFISRASENESIESLCIGINAKMFDSAEGRNFLLEQVNAIIDQSKQIGFHTLASLIKELGTNIEQKHRQILMDRIPAYLESPLCLAVALQSCAPVFKTDPSVMKAFILALAQSSGSVAHECALRFTLELEDDLAKELELPLWRCAHKWECDTVQGMLLADLHGRFNSELKNPEEAIRKIKLLQPIKSDHVQFLCARLIIRLKPDTYEDIQTINELVNSWFECNSVTEGAKALMIADAFVNILEHIRAHKNFGIFALHDFGIKICRYARARVKTCLEKGLCEDEFTYSVAKIAIEFVCKENELIRLNYPLYVELSQTCVRLMQYLFTQTDLMFVYGNLATQVWNFFSWPKLYVTQSEGLMPLLAVRQRAAKDFRYAPELKNKRENEFKLKIMLIRSAIEGLYNQQEDYSELLNIIFAQIRVMIIEFAEVNKEIISLVHTLIFSWSHPAVSISTDVKRRTLCDFFESIAPSLDFSGSIHEKVEIHFYLYHELCPGVKSNVSVLHARNMLVRCAQQRNSYWITQAIVSSSHLERRMDPKAYFTFLCELYTQASLAIADLDFPIVNNELVFPYLYNKFWKSPLCKRNVASKSLWLETIRTIARCSQAQIARLLKNVDKFDSNFYSGAFGTLAKFFEVVSDIDDTELTTINLQTCEEMIDAVDMQALNRQSLIPFMLNISKQVSSPQHAMLQKRILLKTMSLFADHNLWSYIIAQLQNLAGDERFDEDKINALKSYLESMAPPSKQQSPS